MARGKGFQGFVVYVDKGGSAIPVGSLIPEEVPHRFRHDV